MNAPNAWQIAAAPTSAEYFDESLRQHMLRVYNYMGLGLVVTGVVAFAIASTPAIYQPIFGTPLKWVVMFAPLVFIFFLSFRIQTNNGRRLPRAARFSRCQRRAGRRCAAIC